jgi:non-canonical purine NTP pyrophosphatase (RdgB/HAM1 family)
MRRIRQVSALKALVSGISVGVLGDSYFGFWYCVKCFFGRNMDTLELVLGTHNRGKLREYQALLADAPVRVLMLDDIGLNDFDVDESGTTVEANARLKAHAYAQASRRITMADDTGLEVDALDGRPGVYAARYGGAGLDDRGRCEKLLSELDGIPDERRSARFVCVIVALNPRIGKEVTARGTVEGHIAHSIGGGNEGFGYDSVFIPDGYEVTWSAIPLAEKNGFSHRGNAVRALIPLLDTLRD